MTYLLIKCLSTLIILAGDCFGNIFAEYTQDFVNGTVSEVILGMLKSLKYRILFLN